MLTKQPLVPGLHSACTSQPPAPACSGQVSHEQGDRAGGGHRASDGEVAGPFQAPHAAERLGQVRTLESSRMPLLDLLIQTGPAETTFNGNNHASANLFKSTSGAPVRKTYSLQSKE